MTAQYKRCKENNAVHSITCPLAQQSSQQVQMPSLTVAQLACEMTRGISVHLCNEFQGRHRFDTTSTNEIIIKVPNDHTGRPSTNLNCWHGVRHAVCGPSPS